MVCDLSLKILDLLLQVLLCQLVSFLRHRFALYRFLKIFLVFCEFEPVKTLKDPISKLFVIDQDFVLDWLEFSNNVANVFVTQIFGILKFDYVIEFLVCYVSVVVSIDFSNH